jgi:coenzyme F420-0:L-glutamate ligase / coenzyme F420-1:gamma-L-glutamate ligase
VVDRLLAAAIAAPSAHNRQPWRFAILDEAASQERLAVAMGNRLREDRRADGDDPDNIERDVARSHARITEAPLAILVCLDTGDMDAYPDERRRTAEHVMAIQSTAMAMQNILLAAHAEGLGACVMCAPLFCAGTVAAALDLPDGWEPQSLVTIGPPASGPKDRPRLPLEKIIWRPR